MARAYVVMNCKIGSETGIIESLKQVKGVKEVHGILGLYDLIAQIELESEDAIRDTVTNTIRKIPNIHSTMTLTRSESEGLFQDSEGGDSGNTSKAYLVIHCNKGDEFSTLKDLCNIPEVKDADVVFGLYDVICKIESSSEDSLQDTILKQVRKLPKIKSCMTLNIVN
ncbi:Lrp/AsnC ligand binding domain-containing protein [Nitrosopumilus sp.]|uniref:Lrp/AsnC ligand binding domain-containing protein n=1 Tax=Nitrosopumilus sp. TaxID=2024843 RepID=UPI003B5B677E